MPRCAASWRLAQGADRLADHVAGLYKEYAWTVVFAADAGTPLEWARLLKH
ncbi:hypothetical protein LP420_37505 [Massilia sp. B-10]|nr:hypothetical protein LP420_37505 [Massilia sp. B-10]